MILQLLIAIEKENNHYYKYLYLVRWVRKYVSHALFTQSYIPSLKDEYTTKTKLIEVIF